MATSARRLADGVERVLGDRMVVWLKCAPEPHIIFLCGRILHAPDIWA